MIKNEVIADLIKKSIVKDTYKDDPDDKLA